MIKLNEHAIEINIITDYHEIEYREKQDESYLEDFINRVVTNITSNNTFDYCFTAIQAAKVLARVPKAHYEYNEKNDIYVFFPLRESKRKFKDWEDLD